MERSQQLGVRGDAPGHVGIGRTFAGQRLVVDPAALDGVDVAVVGAPFDDGTSNRPGTRFGPRAIRAADDGGHGGRPHLGTGLDPFATLDVVDYGDAAVAPGDLVRSHGHLADVLREVLGAGAMPLVLGGDHSLALPTMRALSERFGPDGYAVVQFDTHADTAAEVYGVRVSHGTPFRVAVEEGYLNGHNIVQLGLRGTWPAPADFEWMRAQGFRWHTMDEIDTRGLDRIVDDIVAHMRGRAKRVYLTVDVDALDPAFAPGTGTPEPGGLTTRELRGALRRIASELDLCAADVVEVCPPFDVAGITALAAERIAIDILTGMAARRTGTSLD
jgi:agmatinase